MAGTDASTDEYVVLPWRRSDPPEAEAALHLVIAWLLNEPERTGQVAAVDRACWLGRGSAGDDGVEAVRFFHMRPQQMLPAPRIASTAISRRQLVLEPAGDDEVRVQCVGRRALFHNGVEKAECVARAGDTLMLEDTAVFLLEERPKAISGMRHFPEVTFAFGQADAQGLVGESVAAWTLRDQLASAAASEDHVLVTGDSGAGKELAAWSIHALSRRAAKSFVARNATTLPAGLLDAELFGNAKNYPNTGSPERPGLIGAADGGTLLLDEIGDLAETHQAHLLRVLDGNGEYHRLGEAGARRSDFRLIAATNRSFDALKHDFLARFPRRIHVPGLAERRSDVPFLIRELMARAAEQSRELVERFCDDGDPRRPRVDPLLLDGLLRHRYTHHTRELGRLLRLSMTTSPPDYLAATPEVMRELRTTDSSAAAPGGPRALEHTREEVRAVLRSAGGNVTQAAERLGMSRHALHRLIRKLKVEE